MECRGMQRYVLRADAGSVTLLHPDTPAEYEQARAEVETSGRPNVEREPGRPGLTSRLAGCIRRRPAEAKPGGSAGDDSATPAGEDGAATAETAGGGYYVVTTSQRRAWGLPDLAKEAGAPRHRAGGRGGGRETSRGSGSRPRRGDGPALRGRRERVGRPGPGRLREGRNPTLSPPDVAVVGFRNPGPSGPAPATGPVGRRTGRASPA